MNNLMISFSSTDLTRLRTLVAAVANEIALVPGSTKPADGEFARTALDTTWSNLVEMLDLGPEPAMGACPKCKHSYLLGATRCGHCWTSLPPVEAGNDTAAAPTTPVG
jgi:hypothetical protein